MSEGARVRNCSWLRGTSLGAMKSRGDLYERLFWGFDMGGESEAKYILPLFFSNRASEDGTTR